MSSFYDARPVAVTNNPTQRQDFAPPQLPGPPGPLEMIQNFIDFLVDFGFDAIKQLTGIDLSSIPKFFDFIFDAIGLDLPGLADLNPLNLLTGIIDAFTGIELSPGAILGAITAALSTIVQNIVNLFGGGFDLNQLIIDPAQIWENVIGVFIKPLQAFAELIGGFINGLQIPILDPTKILNLPNLFTDFTAVLLGLFNGLTGGQSGSATPADVAAAAAAINGRVTVLEGGGVVTVYTVSSTWSKPIVSPTTGAPYQPTDLFTIICINGGNGGNKSGGVSLAFARGGQSGGYVARKVKYADLLASYAMTIGVGGGGAGSEGSGGTGGTTSFGSLVLGTSGLGAEYREDGSYAISIPPGNGGSGAARSFGIAAEYGVSGPFAAGGSPGIGTPGGNGSSAPPAIPSGGGGGGGGGAFTAGLTAGNGGFPGGGGGGGGLLGGGSPSAGNGGSGGSGCIYVIAPY